MTLTLHASTDRHKEWGGPKRYIRIIVYDTTAELRAAAKRYRPDTDWSKSSGGFHPSLVREKCNKQGKWVSTASLHWAGVMRLSREYLTVEVITHECVHAAAAIYRMDVKARINLDADCGPREEALAYIVGDLTHGASEALIHQAKIW